MDNLPDMDDLLDQLEANENPDPVAHKPRINNAYLTRIERFSNDDAKGIGGQLLDLQVEAAVERKEKEEVPEKTVLVDSAANNVADILISIDQQRTEISSQTNGVDDSSWEVKLQSSAEVEVEVDAEEGGGEIVGQNCSPPEEDASTDPCDLPEADQDSIAYAEGNSSLPTAEPVVSTVDPTLYAPNATNAHEIHETHELHDASDAQETPADVLAQSEIERSEFESIVADCSSLAPTDVQHSSAQFNDEAEIGHRTPTFEHAFVSSKQDDDADSVSSGEMERYLADVQLDMALDERVEENAPAEDDQHAVSSFIADERLSDVDDMVAPTEDSQKEEDRSNRFDDYTAGDDGVPAASEPTSSRFLNASQLADDLEAVIESAPMRRTGETTALVASSELSSKQLVDSPSRPETETSSPAEGDGEEVAVVENGSSAVENDDAADDGDYASIVLPEEDDVPLDEEEQAVEAVNEEGEGLENGDDVAENGPTSSIADEVAGAGQPQSVVASTHDISASPVRRLTESEMMLGKIKPYWIPDPDSPSCLICLNKFTVFRRRHHCRSCGRVLCATCCSKKAALPYMGDDSKEYKVCEPCFVTLKSIADIEKESATNRDEQQQEQQQLETNGNETDQTQRIDGAGAAAGPTGRSKPAIRLPAAQGDGPSSSEGRRSVTFRDGVKPGSGVDAGTSSVVKAVRRPRPGRSGRGVSRRVLQLQIEEELACLLPVDNELTPMIIEDGQKLRAIDGDYVSRQLAAGKTVEIAIKRNLSAVLQIAQLDCCGQGEVWCVSSRGLHTIGVEEIVVVYERLENEADVHYDLLKMIDQAFDNALKSTPVRKVSDKVHCFHTFGEKKNPKFLLGGPFCSALVLFRPTVQCLSNLSLPNEPFLCGAFIHEMEMAWAIACPARLLYRLGLEYGYYPTPIVNKRSRPPVFGPVGHMSVMKVFTDFRNWSYRMSALAGSRVSLQEKQTTVYIPKACASEMRTLVDSNKNMVAWAVSFNHEADGHLVCSQSATGGNYSTQVINIRGRDRKTTGATFVIFDGALKAVDQTVQVSIVEDGVAIRVRPDTMQTLTERLNRAEDMRIDGGPDGDSVSIVWTDQVTFVPPGAAVSPVDGRSLETLYRYAVDPTRLVTATAAIPNANKWALRLAQLINLADGRMDEVVENKVITLCEQIGIQLASTIAPFVHVLIGRNQRSVVLRVRVGPDTAEYEAGVWADGLEEEHGAWVAMLDDQLVGTLFNISAYFGSGFHVELFFAIVETGYSVVE